MPFLPIRPLSIHALPQGRARALAPRRTERGRGAGRLAMLAALALWTATLAFWSFPSRGAWANDNEILTEAEREFLRKKGAITFISQTRYPPFEFVDADGAHNGMCVELARWMATELGFEARFLDTSFQQAQEAVLSGRADVLTSLFYSEKRDETFDFTQTLWEVPATIFVSIDRPDIQGLADLAGKRIAMQAGDYARDFLEERQIAFTPLVTHDFAEATDAVIAGHADALIGDEQIVLYHVYKSGQAHALKRVGEPLYLGRNCMATRQGETLIRDILNKGVNLAREAGVLDKIYRKWLGEPLGPEAPWYITALPHIATGAVVIALLALWVYAWNVRLRRLVHRRTRELQRSEELHRTLIQNIPAGFFRFTPQPGARILMINPALARLLGLAAPEEVQGQPPERLFEDAGAAEAFFTRLAAEGEVLAEPLVLRRGDGGLFWGSVTATAVRGENGAILYFDGVIEDVTERRRAEETLRESEERFRRLSELTSDFAYAIRVDADGSLHAIWITDAAERITGLPGGGLTALERHAHPADLDTLRRRRERLLANEPDICEYRIYTREGQVVWLRDYARPLWDEEAGRVTGFLGAAQDITERKRAEEERRRSEERFRELYEHMRDGMAAVNLEGRITECNPAFLALLGYNAEEVRRLTYREITPPHWHEMEERILSEQVLARGYSELYEKEYIRKTGEIIPVEMRTYLLRGEEGQPSGFWATIRDLSERRRVEEERRRLEAQMLQAQKLESLGVLAGGIAHDFNNLLMGILGNTDLALSEISLISPARESLLEIERISRRAADLCQQLLAYSGLGKLIVEPVDLQEIIEEMTHLLEVSISKKAKLIYHFSPNLPLVRGDATQLRQILMNLLINASEALGEHAGVIALSTGAMECDEAYLRSCYLDQNLAPGLYVYLEVADTGCGMTPAQQQRIFDPFYTTKFTGRGLGLAAVQGIVRGHGGAIRIESELGRGSIFRILFPAYDEPVVQAAERAAERAPLRAGGLALLVDDEETVRAVSRRMLEKHGFRVITASDGHEAIEQIRQHGADISCVVLDLMMPRMDGEETWRELRRLRPGLPILLSSGYTEQEILRRFEGVEISGFLQKPYTTEQLLEALRKIFPA